MYALLKMSSFVQKYKNVTTVKWHVPFFIHGIIYFNCIFTLYYKAFNHIMVNRSMSAEQLQFMTSLFSENGH